MLHVERVPPQADHVIGRPVRARTSLAVAAVLGLACVGDPFAPKAEDNGFVYITLSVDAPTPYWLLTIDAATHEEIDRVSLNAYPTGVAVTPRGEYAYVSTRSWQGTDLPTIGGVSVIETASNEVIASVETGRYPFVGPAITPDGALAYVTDFSDSTMTVIKTPVFQGVAQIFSRGVHEIIAASKLPASPTGIAITSDGAYAYISLSNSNVVVVETGTHAIVAQIPVGINPYLLDATPDGRFVYVANFGSDDVSVIATATHTVIDTIDVARDGGDGPYGVAITPDGAYVYVSNWTSDNVSVIETATNTVVATIDVNNVGLGIAMTGHGDYLYVTGGDSVTCVIEIATNTVIERIATGGYTRGAAAGPARG